MKPRAQPSQLIIGYAFKATGKADTKGLALVVEGACKLGVTISLDCFNENAVHCSRYFELGIGVGGQSRFKPVE